MSETVNATAPAAPAKPKRPKPKSMIMLGEQSAALMENARLAKERGEMVGWSTSIFPQEIAESLGLNILYPENFSAGIAARKQADPYLQMCEGPLEYNNDLCSYAKINLAYAEAMHEGGAMAMPDFLCVTNNICNQVTKWFENLSKTLNIPLFMIDTCYNYEDYVTESRVKYVRGQIEKYIKDLCEYTGKTWDEKRFQEVMEISAENKDLWIEANEMLAHKPSPMNGFDLFNYVLHGLQPGQDLHHRHPQAAHLRDQRASEKRHLHLPRGGEIPGLLGRHRLLALPEPQSAHPEAVRHQHGGLRLRQGLGPGLRDQ